MMAKQITLVLILIAIVGSIIYLESGKVKVPEGENISADIPLMADKATTTKDSMINEKDTTKSPVTTESTPTTKTTSAPTINPNGRLMSLDQKSKTYERAKEISTPDGFINTDGQPINVADNIGKKVIMIDFWTYSCINCQRTLPYINSWEEKYGDKGLLIIGVHTPEFEFEKDYDNVKAAVEKYGIKYPVVLDNDYSTWRSYRNNYWPRKYLIDIDGFIVYDHIGEGGYEDTEKKIQELLDERAKVLGDSVSTDVPVTQEKSSSFNPNQSPETYFGAGRNQYFGNGDIGKAYEDDFVLPNSMDTNKFYLSGKWKITSEYAEALEPGASFYYPYNAKNVYMVAESDSSQGVSVSRDNKAPGQYSGKDVSSDSKVNIGVSDLYGLINEVTTGTHTLKIEAAFSGLKIYTLTFGS